MAVAHVVGGLTLDEGRMFRSHLLECMACRARVGELRAIAHDLADVERDERRERAAQRTETKEREGDAPDQPPAPSPRLRWRGTLIIVAVLGGLMALASWNFVLRSQLEAARERIALQPAAVNVLQEGTRWQVQTPAPGSQTGIDGQVATLDGELAVLVEGLADDTYRWQLNYADGTTEHGDPVTVSDGALFVYLASAQIDGAVEFLVVRADGSQDAGPTVFAAARPAPDEPPSFDAEAGPELQPAGTSGR